MPEIDMLKLLLLMGVVLIHCDYSTDLPSEDYYSNIGIRLCHYVSSAVCSVCVPGFFVISGFLFFKGIASFTSAIYLKRIKTRVRSLLVPYIAWCAICCILLFIKHQVFHMSGLGIFLDNGEIDIWNFVKGFWNIDAVGYPYAFAFWFIRNLMMFVLLSPIVWFLCRKAFIFAAFITVCLVLDTQLYGFIWFVIGAFFAQLSNNGRVKLHGAGPRNWIAISVFSIVFWVGVVLLVYLNLENFKMFVNIPMVCSALYLGLELSWMLVDHKLFNKLIPATFMIYATHQCYCTLVRKSFIHLLGLSTVISAVAVYILSFMILILVGYAVYFFLRKYSPGCLLYLTGGRVK